MITGPLREIVKKIKKKLVSILVLSLYKVEGAALSSLTIIQVRWRADMPSVFSCSANLL